MLIIAAYIGVFVFLCLWLPSVLSVGAASLGSFILTLSAAVSAATAARPAEYRALWLTAIAALPVFGAAVYFFMMFRPSRRAAAPAPRPIGYDSMRYFEEGKDFFAALIYAIERARASVLLEFYIIAKGRVFDRLCSALEGALRRGAEVKIMTDGLGSALRLPKKQLRRLKKLGAEVKIFNRLLPPPLSRLNFRNHRKIAVIDGRTAYFGGMNIADEYAAVTRPYGHWKDSAFEVTGCAAEFFGGLFMNMWSGEKQGPVPEGGKGYLSPVYDCPPEESGRASAALCRALFRAEKRIWIFTPYLCPDERIFTALCDAAERGADVKISVPAIPDKRSAYAVTADYAARLWERGVEVYAYTPGFMHAKAVLCDDLCFAGSYNLDCRSMWLNYECGAFFDGDAATDVARDFCNCLALSAPFYGKKRKAARLFSPLA